MKKAALVTCYFKHNYGSMLQAYATQLVMDKLGVENETVDISNINGEIRKDKIKYFLKASFTSDILLSKIGMVRNIFIKKWNRGQYGDLSRLRDEKFDSFVTQYIRLSRAYKSKSELSEVCEDTYHTVVVGSDQLWLPANIEADYYTLNFVPEQVNKIAYATSFGMSSLPKHSIEKAKKFLERINYLSVREDSGQLLIRDIANIEVPIVCDPTLLFTGEEWMHIQNEEAIEKEPYIFCYFLGNNFGHREFAIRLREKTGYKIVALLHLDEYVEKDCDYADVTPYDVGPSEFLNYLRNARYVCTDSFHGSVFSNLYHKEFYTFRRYTRKTKQSTNSRIENLLKQLGLEERLLIGNENIEECMNGKIDYLEVEKKIEAMRQISYEYLQQALK